MSLTRRDSSPRLTELAVPGHGDGRDLVAATAGSPSDTRAKASEKATVLASRQKLGGQVRNTGGGCACGRKVWKLPAISVTGFQTLSSRLTNQPRRDIRESPGP